MKRIIRSLLPMLLLVLMPLIGTSCWEDLGKRGFFPVVLSGFMGTDYVRLDVRMPDGTPVIMNKPSLANGTISFVVGYAGLYYCTFKYYRIKPLDIGNPGLDYHPVNMTLEVLQNGKYHFRGTDLIKASSGSMDLAPSSVVLQKPAYLCGSELKTGPLTLSVYGTDTVFLVNTYNAKNLITGTTIYAGSNTSAPLWGTVTYTYDWLGKLLSKTTDAVNDAYDTYTAYTYLYNRVVNVTQYAGNSSHGAIRSFYKYTYNLRGYITNVKLYIGGPTSYYMEQEFILDTLNKATQVNAYTGTAADGSDKSQQVSVAVAYNAAGLISQCSFNTIQAGGDMITNYQYNAYKMLTGFSMSAGDIGGVMNPVGDSSLQFAYNSETGYTMVIDGPVYTETMIYDTSYAPLSYLKHTKELGNMDTRATLTYDAYGNAEQVQVFAGPGPDPDTLMNSSRMTWIPAL